jgi:hypothetical protein
MIHRLSGGLAPHEKGLILLLLVEFAGIREVDLS